MTMKTPTKTPSQEKFASLYFPDAGLLNDIKKEADRRKTSFNKLIVSILTQIIPKILSNRGGKPKSYTVKI